LEAYFRIGHQLNTIASLKIGADGNEEIATDVDKKVEKICIRFLYSVFPKIPVFAEEHYKNSDIFSNEGWVFIVDPIDGTEEFLKGSHEWSISLSAVTNLIPFVGMLLMPQDELRLFACKGEGVACTGGENILKKQNRERKKIAISPRQVLISEYKDRIQRSGFEPIPISTLTIKIVSILMGKVDAGIYFPQVGRSAKIWDYAAAILLLEEFGGKMTSLDGSPMPFHGQRIVHKEGWLATNCFCNHDELLRKIQ
jgi:3'-phosphoadenosine 5'-phosphosulfate (PAPS) 3'-phosphatase